MSFSVKTRRLVPAWLLVAGLLLSGQAFALSPAAPELERECTYGDCQNGFGILEIKTELGTDVYEGNFRDGEFHGFGTYTRYVTGRTRRAMKATGGKESVMAAEPTGMAAPICISVNGATACVTGGGSYFFNQEDWSPNRYTENWLKENTENYTGEFVDDQFQGEGVYRWADGRRYEGEFFANQKHGRGRFYYETGTSLPQEWEYGELVD